jgi:SAM-dependent methyltransferase
MFDGHYVNWRQTRIQEIERKFGKEWFVGKKILELGCGFAHIGEHFRTLGAIVSACDARQDSIRTAKDLHPLVDSFVCDLEKDFPEGEWDLVINTGLLYHLDNFELCLRNSLRAGQFCVIETEVLDSFGLDPIKVSENNDYDQAFGRYGSRMPALLIEKIIESENHKFERIDEGRLNSNFHRYDWKEKNDGDHVKGLRRFWFTEKSVEATHVGDKASMGTSSEETRAVVDQLSTLKADQK